MCNIIYYTLYIKNYIYMLKNMLKKLILINIKFFIYNLCYI